MKMIKTLAIFCCIMLGASCTLDLRQDPNAVQPDQAIPNLILNSLQRNTANLFSGTSNVGMVFTRQLNSGGSTYRNVYTPNSFDGTWSLAYANILEDATTLTKLTDAAGMARHSGMARVLQAYTMILLVDMFGDVPYSKALQGSGEFNPSVDDMSSVYDAALALLDQAILDLNTGTVAQGGYLAASAPAPADLFYGGNFTRWTVLANTIKLKVYLNKRLIDGAGSTTAINALLADNSPTGGLIGWKNGVATTSADNFVFRYGISKTDPDSRHPLFVAGYPNGGGNYQSNWFMWHLFHGYDATHNGGTPGDPRMRFYIYRQVASNSSDPNLMRCVTGNNVPAHYPAASGSSINVGAAGALPPGISNVSTNAAWSGGNGITGGSRTFCYPTDRGYWGRDHVNNEGIPPDAFQRSQFGAYPAGGRYDGATQAGVNENIGMLGAGIQPIMMRSFVQFMLAEAALTLGTTGTAATYFANGMTYSFNDVREWATTGNFAGSGMPSPSTTEASTIATHYPAATYTTDFGNYITAANAAYTAATDKLNFIAREYWISAFGNGVEMYNLYRRTGRPTGMQPKIILSAGDAFPRSMYYPQTFASLNNTVTQKENLGTSKVFWDTNTDNLDF